MQGSEKMLNIPCTIVTSYWDLSNAILQISEKVALRRSEFFLTILKFASLQIQNSPSDLRHWVCDRFASLRMITEKIFALRSELLFPVFQRSLLFSQDLHRFRNQ
jgi:hypothetical protein